MQGLGSASNIDKIEGNKTQVNKLNIIIIMIKLF